MTCPSPTLQFPLVPPFPPLAIPNFGITLPPVPPSPCLPCSFSLGVALPSFLLNPVGNLGLGIPAISVQACGCKLTYSGKTIPLPIVLPTPVAQALVVAQNALLVLAASSISFQIKCPKGLQADLGAQ